ncbi:hypothetical protein KBJ94_23480 [Pseudomonas sp. ITA]|uniref:hypothetical protein n=1 Tax=Pseudomonas sp. ITA TaxID=2825841 RepID=UPI002498522D|nr:hypothetical protein [Pseudomonas sp. ITA]MDI2145015.1 hypothetical protein [Pseudomonas sp. ITA]
MRGKHYPMTLLLAIGVFPGVALADPVLQNMADSLDEWMKFMPMLMWPMVILAMMKIMFSGSSGQSGERESSANTPSPLPSTVKQLQESANKLDPVAISNTERSDPNPVEPPGTVGRKLHLD